MSILASNFINDIRREFILLVQTVDEATVPLELGKTQNERDTVAEWRMVFVRTDIAGKSKISRTESRDRTQCSPTALKY